MNDATSPAAITLHGGCLCGKVRYSVAVEKPEGYYCHCRMCQLAFGNTRAAYLNVRKDHVHWHGQRAAYASSKIAVRGFCANCGTPLSFEYNGSERMDLSVGSLDEPGRLVPVTHFGIETRVENWHADDGLPGQRLDTHQTILSRWREAYGDGVVPGLDATRGKP
jgi:hypothetical protein